MKWIVIILLFLTGCKQAQILPLYSEFHIGQEYKIEYVKMPMMEFVYIELNGKRYLIETISNEMK